MFRLAEPAVTVLLSVTSPVCRPPANGKVENETPEDTDLVPNDLCIRALADLRRAKWFHVCQNIFETFYQEKFNIILFNYLVLSGI